MAEYYFNLPPITTLTIPQQAALDDPAQIALSGGPGTGKSVVSVWRHISNHMSNPAKKSLLLTYTTTLKEYLKACCRSQNEDAAKMVATSLKSRDKIHKYKFAEKSLTKLKIWMKATIMVFCQMCHTELTIRRFFIQTTVVISRS